MFESLKRVALCGGGQDNAALQAEIERVKSANAHRFLQDHELKYRKFYDQPSSYVPLASYVQKVPKVSKKK
jgi:hypothetical protein